jgi:hypothetical protein
VQVVQFKNSGFNKARNFSVDDYLQLIDWKFDRTYERGKTSNLYWLKPKYEVDFEKFIEFPSRYRILITYLDFFTGGATDRYYRLPGWTNVSDCVLSDVNLTPSEIIYDHDTTVLFIDNLSEAEVVSKLGALKSGVDDSEHIFWKRLESFQPFLFYRKTDCDFFASTNEQLLDNLCTDTAVDDAETRDKVELKELRKRKWEALGPECGPEKCSVINCTRLRIKLAMLCFIHQEQRFGGLT